MAKTTALADQKILWKPQAKQAEALVRTEFEILYGGARGGGKTDAGMMWLLYDVGNPDFRALVIRLNAKDLSDWIERARKWYAPFEADFKGNPTEIHFPSGAIIRTGHLKDENAYTQYQGHEYHRILIEELTQIPDEKSYIQLISSCRTSNKALRPQIFCTTNPGNAGHAWVKERWCIPDDVDFGKIYCHKLADRVFVPGRVQDNAALVEANPEYVEMLRNLPDEALRKAWYEGSWGNPKIEGAVYEDEINWLYANGHIGDVPHDPKYPVYTVWDWGGHKNLRIGFFQAKGGAHYMIDYYSGGGQGFPEYATMLRNKPYYYVMHIGPHDLLHQESSGETRRQVAAEHGIDFYVLKKPGDIIDGIEGVKMKMPMLYVDKVKCQKFLDAIKSFRYEEFDVTKGGGWRSTPRKDWTEHDADMLRYWGMAPTPMDVHSRQEEFALYDSEF